MSVLQILTATVLLLCHIVFAETIGFVPPQSWENINYKRSIDVSNSYIKELAEITIKNIGDKPADRYYLSIPTEVFNKVSVFSASLSDVNAYIESALVPEIVNVNGSLEVSYGLIKLPAPIQPHKDVTITITYAYNQGTEPYPKHIDLGEDQHILLTTNSLPISAYETKAYVLEFTGSSSFSELVQDSTFSGMEEGDKYIYGPYENIGAFEFDEPVKMIYRHNLPLPRVTHLSRSAWVSHWASTLQFEEYYELINDAAALKSGFSRATYMKEQHALKPSSHLVALDMTLPPNSEDHYFTDLVGMVSTSRVLGDHFFLKPRYPIIGSWKYNFTIGWTNQLSQFLHVDNQESNVFVLSVPVLNGPMDTFYDTVEMSVFLPEGSEILDVESPIPIIKTKIDNQKSYFDLNRGHVKVTVDFKNAIDAISNGELIVRYKYTKAAFFKKPLSIAIYIFIALTALFFLKQVDLTIKK